jgi:hypothetical protein
LGKTHTAYRPGNCVRSHGAIPVKRRLLRSVVGRCVRGISP